MFCEISDRIFSEVKFIIMGRPETGRPLSWPIVWFEPDF